MLKTKIALLLFVVQTITSQIDVCHDPFSEFMHCMAKDTSARLRIFEKEASFDVEKDVNQCFISYDCSTLDFSKANLNELIEPKWAEKVETIMKVISSTEPRVRMCMVEYFAGLVKEKIQKCIRETGDDLDEYTMPDLPKLENFDIQKLKKPVLNRIYALENTVECSKNIIDNSTLQNLVDCTKNARSESKDSLCLARNSCKREHILDYECTNRYERVQKAGCECFQREIEKIYKSKADVSEWKKTTDNFLKGDVERKYESCCIKYNVPYPEADVKAVVQAVRQSVVHVAIHGMPKKVVRIISQLMHQINEEGQKLFCTDCYSGASVDDLKDAEAIRNLAAIDPNDGNGGFLNKGLKGFLDKIFRNG